MSSITTPITPQVALEPGTEAPDIRLPSTPDQLVSLHEFRGRNVILVFYPADWSPVCGDQTALYDELLPEFHRLNAELLGISVDGWRVPGKPLQTILVQRLVWWRRILMPRISRSATRRRDIERSRRTGVAPEPFSRW